VNGRLRPTQPAGCVDGGRPRLPGRPARSAG